MIGYKLHKVNITVHLETLALNENKLYKNVYFFRHA